MTPTISICNIAYVIPIILVIIFIFQLRKYIEVNQQLHHVNAIKARRKKLDASRERFFGSEQFADTIPPENARELPARRRGKSKKKGVKTSDELPPFPEQPRQGATGRRRSREPLPPPPPDDGFEDDDYIYY